MTPIYSNCSSFTGFQTVSVITYGYGSIPMKIPFGMGVIHIHKSQLFWCELQGYKVLTHCHMVIFWETQRGAGRHRRSERRDGRHGPGRAEASVFFQPSKMGSLWKSNYGKTMGKWWFIWKDPAFLMGKSFCLIMDDNGWLNRKLILVGGDWNMNGWLFHEY